MKPSNFKVFLAVAPLEIGELIKEPLPWGHIVIDSVEEADSVFIWAHSSSDTWAPMFFSGLCAGLNKPFALSAPSKGVLLKVRSNLAKAGYPGVAISSSINKSIRSAYEESMADADVLFPYRPELTTIYQQCECSVCGNAVFNKEKAYVWRPASQGLNDRHSRIMHPGCFEITRNPGKLNNVHFYEEMITALRAENSALEQSINQRLASAEAPLEQLRQVT